MTKPGRIICEDDKPGWVALRHRDYLDIIALLPEFNPASLHGRRMQIQVSATGVNIHYFAMPEFPQNIRERYGQKITGSKQNGARIFFKTDKLPGDLLSLCPDFHPYKKIR
jgi:hypothetical protein